MKPFPTLVCCAFIAACGQGPGLQQAESGSLRGQDDQAATLRNQLTQAYGTLSTLTGVVSYQEIDSEGSSHASSAHFQSDVKKRWVRAHIDKSDKPNAQGADMLDLADGNVTVRVKFGPFPITKTFAETDQQVTSNRGYAISQTDFVAMVNLVLDPNAHVVALGQIDEMGHHVDGLDISPSPLSGCQHEHVGLDPASHLPIVRQAFAADRGGKDQDVFDQVLDDPSLNPDLPPDTWKL